MVPLLIVSSVALLVSLPAGTMFGPTHISFADVVDVWQARITGGADGSVEDRIVWNIRAPRVILAAIVGGGLAVAGTIVQTLVRNPLADPYLLGVSAGASVGATAVITLGVLAAAGTWAISAGAMIGAVLAAIAVFGITLSQGGLTPLRLVLTGTVLASAFSAMASYLVFRSAEPQMAQGVLFWLLGSLARASWEQLLLPLVVLVAVLVPLVLIRGWLDGLLTGADVAEGLGVPVARLRIVLFVSQAVLVGVMVAVSGAIGFVGLIIPHVARLLVGPLHGRLLPVAAVLGALFLVWVDVAARVLAPPQDIPLSVVTGIVGAPVFLVLLGRRRYRFGGES
ncbi:iron ABC transporter permease [Nocardioides sp. AE5]|uniref:FecCD family ABC transporter permease n=1 Tax=Nocardioides sp. AE5 TaxID=2962573 RepID=UPI0028812242|nr:iron ABC transporter permease [Nocardioides sp. AE5]MDT0202187.1 iron ABC transporter permease [Nocardioides sp. AE5]